MSQPHEPKRLELEASPGLKQAIDALRSDGPSPAGKQRMAQTLDRWLAAPPVPAGPLSGPLGKIALVVLASGAVLAFWSYAHRTASAPQPALLSTAAQAVDSAPNVTEIAAPAALPAPSSGTAPALRGGASIPQPADREEAAGSGSRLEVAQRTPPSSSSTAPALRGGASSSSTAPALRGGASSARSARRKLAPALRASTPAPGVSGTAPGLERARVSESADRGESAAATASSAVEPSTTPTPVAPPVAVPAPARVAPTEPARNEQLGASAPPQWDEAAMLQRARRLAHDRPAEALRLLDEHKRRFAQGMLAPEREVLAIEILRAQSRDAEARARLNAFRQHYPDSVYLERLEHPGPRPRP